MSQKTIPTWITVTSGAILTAFTAGIGIMSFPYVNFQTVKAAEAERIDILKHIEQNREDLSKRLDRIEDKLDRVLEDRHRHR